jgi:predicted enzyme related to lactoylglutathione lyase
MTGILLNIDVDDLKRAERFYCEAFGLRLGRRIAPGATELLGWPAALYLLETAAGSAPLPAASTRRDYTRHWTPVHLDIVVDAIEPARARAIAAGATAEGEIRTPAFGRICQLADPFGHGLCLIEFNERGYDALIDP